LSRFQLFERCRRFGDSTESNNNQKVGFKKSLKPHNTLICVHKIVMFINLNSTRSGRKDGLNEPCILCGYCPVGAKRPFFLFMPVELAPAGWYVLHVRRSMEFVPGPNMQICRAELRSSKNCCVARSECRYQRAAGAAVNFEHGACMGEVYGEYMNLDSEAQFKTKQHKASMTSGRTLQQQSL
jgi:hypothetical protein